MQQNVEKVSDGLTLQDVRKKNWIPDLSVLCDLEIKKSELLL